MYCYFLWQQREIVRASNARPYGFHLVVYHFLQMFTMILQFAAGTAIIGRKAREQVLNTQLFPFFAAHAHRARFAAGTRRRQLDRKSVV